MALGDIDKLISKLGETEGKALPFSLLGVPSGEQRTAVPDIAAPSGTAAPTPDSQASPDLFSSISNVRESGVKLGKDLAAGIQEGVGSIFGQKPSSDKDKALKKELGAEKTPKSSPSAPRNIAPPAQTPQFAPLQGGPSQTQQPSLPEGKQTGVNRLQQILSQQAELRNQIRNRRQ